MSYLVPGIGIEPIRLFETRDFKFWPPALSNPRQVRLFNGLPNSQPVRSSLFLPIFSCRTAMIQP